MKKELELKLGRYTAWTSLNYAVSEYKKETNKDPHRYDTKVADYWDELDKTSDLVTWWERKLKLSSHEIYEYLKLREYLHE